MLLQEDAARAAELVDEAERIMAQLEPRERGIHVSDLIGCLRKYHYRRAGVAIPAREQEQRMMFLLGHGFHKIFERDEREAKVQLVLRGGAKVHGTIDYLGVELPNEDDPVGVYRYVPTEIKTTRLSANKSPEDSQQYIEQLATYCIAVDSRHGQLVVCHMNGNYSTERRPILKVWDIEFDEMELQGWHDELSRRYDILVGDELPEGENNRYECSYCEFHGDRGGPCGGHTGRSTLPRFMNMLVPNWVVGSEGGD